DAFPFALKTQDVDRFVETVKLLSLSFGAVNLEDIAAPRCFEIEERLVRELDIPVMHDDQHGTAIVAAAALMNAAKVVKKSFLSLKVAVVGAGAAGTAIVKLLVGLGLGHIVVLDSRGIVHEGRSDMPEYKKKLARLTAGHGLTGGVREALEGADAVIGVSGPGILTGEHIRLMADRSIVFALANPVPEIMPEEARAAGAAVVATGRSDFANQINNALAYPGVFKGVLEGRRPHITESMKRAAAEALSHYVKKPTPDSIVPDILDRGVARAVADAVKGA
ncbi:MAG: malic enzyme-like NAD(P)-binding protein, partial [Patescibacteria group bacterium]